jgi:hypothetical protein
MIKKSRDHPTPGMGGLGPPRQSPNDFHFFFSCFLETGRYDLILMKGEKIDRIGFFAIRAKKNGALLSITPGNV